MRAYDESYLADAREVLGEAFDCAANKADMPLQRFFELFVATGVADAFGKGCPRYVAGSSGVELFLDVCYRAGVDAGVALCDEVALEETPEYWCGWALAHWQWSAGRPFRIIGRSVTMEQVVALYHPLHEAPEEKFCETMEARLALGPSPLRVQRRTRGLSQRQLAEASGVSLRAIQRAAGKRREPRAGSHFAPASLRPRLLHRRLAGIPPELSSPAATCYNCGTCFRCAEGGCRG